MGFSFLSGLPEKERRRRRLMPIQAFIDDSGSRGQDKMFVFAGLVGPAEAFLDFSERWRACLDAPPRVARFKMQEAARRVGAFNRWKADDRDAKLAALAQCFRGYGFALIAHATDLSGFEATIALAHKRGALSDPYFFAFYSIIIAICCELQDRGYREECELIFDENLIFGPRAMTWYQLIREYILEPEDRAIAPATPLFRSDEKFMPLQAADMMAWFFRRDNSDQPHSYSWLQGMLSRHLVLSNHCQLFDKERMQMQVELSKEKMKEITDQQLRIALRLLPPSRARRRRGKSAR